MEDAFLNLFPKMYRDKWSALAGQVPWIQEIRLRRDKPVIIHKMDGEWYLSGQGLTKRQSQAYCMEEQELTRYVNHFCQDSIYAFQEEIKHGYITVPGGHRIGLAGQVILDNGIVSGMKNITFLNIRLAHQIKGAADVVMPYMYQDGRVLNTLIISPPGCGKTTLLRDMVRQISDGNSFGEGCTVSVIDERSEIAGCYQGVPQNDVGIRTDVLDACPKEQGFLMMLRSMSPKVMAVDELGGESDEGALFKAATCGCKVLATVHGDNVEDIKGKTGWEKIIQGKLFDRYIVMGCIMGKPTVLKIYGKDGQEIYACLK